MLICRFCLQLLHVILEKALQRIFRKEVMEIAGKHVLFTMANGQCFEDSVLSQFGDILLTPVVPCYVCFFSWQLRQDVL